MRATLLPLAWVLFAVLACHAQDAGCVLDLPVGTLGMDYSLLQGLAAQDLTVRADNKRQAIEGIRYDTGPRRILFVLDTDPHLPPDARKVEAQLVTSTLAQARPGDSFALITARGPLHEWKFGVSGDLLRQGAESLATESGDTKSAIGPLDALMEGIGWFGVPEPGDAVMMIARDLEELPPPGRYGQFGVLGSRVAVADVDVPYGPHSRASFRAVRTAAYEHRIRVFGLHLGPMLYSPEDLTSTSDESLFALANSTGGIAAHQTTDGPWSTFRLTDARWQVLQHSFWQLYGAAAQFYVVKVHVPAAKDHLRFDLRLASDIEKNTLLLYPREAVGCARSK